MELISALELRAGLGNDRQADGGALNQACEVASQVIESGWQESSGEWVPGVGPVLKTEGVVEIVDTLGSQLSVAGMILALTSLAEFPSGATLPTEDFAIAGRELWRVDGRRIGVTRVRVTYTAGWVDSTDPMAAPAWAKDAALAVAEQLFRRRFKLGMQVDGPIGFLVPRLTRSLLAPYQPVNLGFA